MQQRPHHLPEPLIKPQLVSTSDCLVIFGALNSNKVYYFCNNDLKFKYLTKYPNDFYPSHHATTFYKTQYGNHILSFGGNKLADQHFYEYFVNSNTWKTNIIDYG